MEKEPQIVDGVTWVVEHAGIRVFGPPATSVRFIPYPEAAVWDFVSRGYTPEVIVSKLRHLDRRLAANAPGWVASVLQDWSDDGLLVGGAD
jgi:hypothetical protein